MVDREDHRQGRRQSQKSADIFDQMANSKAAVNLEVTRTKIPKLQNYNNFVFDLV